MARVSRGILTSGGITTTRLPRLRIDDTGLQSLTEEKQCDASNLFDYLPQINSPHPDFPDLVCKELDPEFLPAGLARFTATYRGFIGGGIGSGVELPGPVWSMESVANLEDIRSYVNFETLVDIAGVGDGAIFDDDGLFVGFKSPQDLRGVQSFFAPSVVIIRRALDSNPNGGASVGNRNNPGGPLETPNTPSGYNWLRIGYSAEQFGNIWQTQTTWLRSGANGWTPLIYSGG